MVRSSVTLSVLMCVHNGDRFLDECIRSVLNQSFEDYEFLILDDGSTDGSLNIIRGYSRKDKRVKVISASRIGLAAGLNKLLYISEGNFIARIDSDDICMPERFHLQVAYLLNNPSIGVCGSNALVIDSTGKSLYHTRKSESDFNLKAKWPESPFIHPSVMFRKSLVLEVGGYPNVPVSQDLFLWSKLKEQTTFANLNESLIKYRIHEKAISRKPKRLTIAVQEYLSCYENEGFKLDNSKTNELVKMQDLITPSIKHWIYLTLILKKRKEHKITSINKSRLLMDGLHLFRSSKNIEKFTLFMFLFLIPRGIYIAALKVNRSLK